MNIYNNKQDCADQIINHVLGPTVRPTQDVIGGDDFYIDLFRLSIGEPTQSSTRTHSTRGKPAEDQLGIRAHDLNYEKIFFLKNYEKFSPPLAIFSNLDQV